MKTAAIPEEPRHSSEISDENRKSILLELEKILASPWFRSAARSKQFLQYVVLHQLEGHSEPLKERTIGTEVFHRSPGYATGEDPVVRVQAGEVRRRLDQFYQNAGDSALVRIELPVGSYSPVFRWAPKNIAEPEPSAAIPVPEPPAPKTIWRKWVWVAICATVVLFAVAAYLELRRPAAEKSQFDRFWDPVFTTQQPALICLAKGVTYRPAPELYDRYRRLHPGKFQTEVERSTEPLPLPPNEKLTWGDMKLLDGYGVALGDVSAAVKFSALLGKLGKTNQVRIGANYSYEDLRNSPAIVIGAFNNRWTIDLLSSQRFAFVINGEEYTLREQIKGGRVWVSRYASSGALEEDYAVAARLLDSKTGQFTVIAAGLRDSGTEAAGEFASNPNYLDEILRNAPPGWQKMNLEVVLKTTITDSIAGPPQLVATYFW